MIHYTKLNQSDKPKLLDTIKNVLIETDAHDLNVSNSDNWSWQYDNLPSSESHIYLAKHNDKIIGYYHIPTYQFIIAHKKIKIGHIQTVAILKEYRGKGVFQKLAEYANSDINNFVDLIYTFPNHKSIHTFLKYNGFKLVRSLPVYVMPIKMRKLIPEKYYFLKKIPFIWSVTDVLFNFLSLSITTNQRVKLIDQIDDEVEHIFLNFSPNKNRLVRDRSFLEWRYRKSPKGKHLIVGLYNKDILQSVVILKEEKIFSTLGYVIMDFSYRSKQHFLQLLSEIKNVKDVKAKSISFLFLSGLNGDLSFVRKIGFLPVPQSLIPRKLNLLTRITGRTEMPEPIDPNTWLITVGDWDVF